MGCNPFSLGFLSTLSLRRATACCSLFTSTLINFYPRSPCGERQPYLLISDIQALISIHALLAESDFRAFTVSLYPSTISIHALLAESDLATIAIISKMLNFYPRSPCGERRLWNCFLTVFQDFYPRSPCGERRIDKVSNQCQVDDFYPRSPCGERPPRQRCFRLWGKFLSTLSLRRATRFIQRTCLMLVQFLSTLSLRRATLTAPIMLIARAISIHALLAESDFMPSCKAISLSRFLSTLSLRRATGKVKVVEPGFVFLSTLSLRRATCVKRFQAADISYFYPRSPCGERLDKIPD